MVVRASSRNGLACRSLLIPLLLATAPLKQARAQHSTVAEEVNEIIVTARRREETLQDIPFSIQAFDQSRLEKLNVVDFQDYARFAPSISFVSNGPGQSKLVIRGVTESTGEGGGGGQSSAALYLDEQPITVDGANPDPRLVDVERIEVLSGPQGTLYGASSQSGTVRIITNKPDATQAEGFAEGGVASTRHGEMSYDLNGMFNLPLVENKLALRVVGFGARDGGYIDNVLGPTPGGTRDNASFVREDVNRSNSKGGRAALRWNFKEDWSATAGYVFQDVNVHGRSDYDVEAGELQTVRFLNEHYDDHWDQASLTVEGNLGFADLVLTGAYFDRKVSYFFDNTAYDFYLTSLAATNPTYYAFYDFGPDPTGKNITDVWARRSTAEMRLTSNDKEARFGWVAGAFYQKSETGYSGGVTVDDYVNTPSYQSVAYLLPGPTDVYFYQALRYEQQQYALFGEMSYALTEKLTATVGGRYYDSSNDGFISTQSPFGLLTGEGELSANESGFTPKVNFSYKAKERLLFFATYSEGIRLGGANRDRPGLAVPVQYDADKLKNHEIGVKSQWLDGRLTLNLTGYLMRWDDFQLQVRNPNPATFFYVIANAGEAKIKGVETEFSLLAGHGFSIGGSATVASSKLADDSVLLDVAKGARLPVAPKFKFALYGDYIRPVPALGGDIYLRADTSAVGSSFNDINPAIARRMDSYRITNFQVGFESQAWKLNLYLNNAFDKRAKLFVDDYYTTLRISPNQPRTLGLTVTRHF